MDFLDCSCVVQCSSRRLLYIFGTSLNYLSLVNFINIKECTTNDKILLRFVQSKMLFGHLCLHIIEVTVICMFSFLFCLWCSVCCFLEEPIFLVSSDFSLWYYCLSCEYFTSLSQSLRGWTIETVNPCYLQPSERSFMETDLTPGIDSI